MIDGIRGDAQKTWQLSLPLSKVVGARNVKFEGGGHGGSPVVLMMNPCHDYSPTRRAFRTRRTRQHYRSAVRKFPAPIPCTARAHSPCALTGMYSAGARAGRACGTLLCQDNIRFSRNLTVIRIYGMSIAPGIAASTIPRMPPGSTPWATAEKAVYQDRAQSDYWRSAGHATSSTFMSRTRTTGRQGLD